MARLIGPDMGSRYCYLASGAPAASLPALVYSNSAGTILADIAAYDGSPTPGGTILGSQVTTDGDGLLPLFWFPDGTDRVWVSVNGGTLTPIDADARVDGRSVDVRTFGADPTGGVDSTAAIQAAIAALPATYGRLVFPAGRYGVSDEIVVSGKSDLVIDGRGAVLELTGAATSASGAKSVVHVTGGQRVHVVGLRIRDTDRAQQYNGLRVSASSDVKLHGLVVRDVRWAGLTVFDSTAGTSRNVEIIGCTVEGTRFGISINSKDTRIVGNHVAMYWPSTAEAASKGGVWSAPSDYYDGIMVLAGSDRTTVADNTITECGQGGVYTQNCTNLTITGNTVSGCQLRGIEIDGDAGTAVGVAIVGNTVNNCVDQINLVRAREVTVSGNRVANTNASLASACIAVNVGTTDTLVTGNHCKQAHATHPAVYVDPAATGITLAWNQVTGANKYSAPSETVIIERLAAGQMKATGKLLATAGVGVGNSATATTLGTVTRKIEVFDASGASLGFVPVYGSIT